ncbi:MAG: hypothetical protein ABH844_03855 [Candidatus Omnitrophota bacterium]
MTLWLTLLLTIVLSYPVPSFSQSVDEKKNEIGHLHKTALLSYDRARKQAEKGTQLKYLENLEQEIEDFYALAGELEKQGEYEKAENCYKRILEIIEEDAGLKPYIDERDKNLKKMAHKSRQLVSKKLQQAQAKKKCLTQNRLKHSKKILKLQNQLERLENE